MDYPIVTLRQLGRLIQDVRNQKRLTQTQLGELAGFAQSAISAMESDPKSTKLERLFQLLSALDLELVIRERNKFLARDEW
jgi:HTH-type transcriptional regulator/antitoxin HipB